MSGPPNPRQYYVYIMASERQTLYTGVTNDLLRRVWEHKQKLTHGFSAKYDCTKLVYYEATNNAHEAIAREKQIKGLLRRKKIDLIRSMNPGFYDLSEGWFDTIRDVVRRDPSLRSG